MRPLELSLIAASAVVLLAAPAVSRAQSDYDAGPNSAMGTGVDTAAVIGGDYTLSQREDWVANHLHLVLKNDDIDSDQYASLRDDLDAVRDDESRMRGNQGGELTDNQTARLEGRLNDISHRMRRMSGETFTTPW